MSWAFQTDQIIKEFDRDVGCKILTLSNIKHNG